MAAVRSPTLEPRVRELYPDYQTEPPDRKPDPAQKVALEENDGGRPPFRIRSGSRVWETESPGAALTRFELALGELLVVSARRGGLHPLHAGGVATEAGALLLVGPGGSGKSTLTAALALRGYPILGDDITLLEGATGRAVPFKRLIKLIPPSQELLGLPNRHGPGKELWSDSALFHPRELGSRWASPAPIRQVVFPRRSETGSGVLCLLSPSEAMRRLLDQLLFRSTVPGTIFGTIADAVKDAGFHELPFSRALDAAHRLEPLLSARPDRGERGGPEGTPPERDGP